MKVVSINSCNFSSTGNIMIGISNTAKENQYDPYMAYPYCRDNLKKQCENSIFIGDRFSRNLHLLFAKLTGFNGIGSIFSTLRFLKTVKELDPKLLHLHNLHNGYINLPILFRYLKKNNISVIWTLHDCWSFTGQCPYFDMVECDKWEKGCYHCSQYREYPESYVDRTKSMYKLKKKWFTGVEDMVIVTPSQWLADLVKKSFLRDYPVKVINNGIDLNVFKPSPSGFKEKYGISEDKYIVLGVAFGWEARKGLDIFIELSKRLDGEKFQIVLVGTDEKTDEELPKNIISIHRTQNQAELAEIYTAADVFANPTREDNFPTVNMEALACGTPVVTFRTGGSPESLDDTCGSVVERDDISAFEKEIVRICSKKPYSAEACLERAKGFDKEKKFLKYIDLYRSIK